jgi:peptidoglycan/xylan/chitin deacetylase (PgdA/CDA1 family)
VKPISAGTKDPLTKGIHHVAITFDDGFLSVIENAVPELFVRKIPSTLFIPTGYFSQYPNCIDDEEGKDRVTADQLGSLNKDLVTIGSHSVTHPDLLLLSEEDARRELCESKRELESILGQAISLFAFPHGAYNQALVELSRHVGYERVFTIMPNLAFSKADEYVTGRFDVSPTDWHLEFKLNLLGAYRWLPFAFLVKRKALQLLKLFAFKSGRETQLFR